MRLGAVISPISYAAALLAAILLVFLAPGTESLAQELTQRHTRKDADKGPRALGLVQITDKGKAHLIPIAIMMDGKFYDAESFKATPVPMALDFGIVYEGFRAGVSQGLFTITQPGQLNHEWIAEGTWLPEGAKPKTDKQKYAPPVIDEGGKDDDRPVLHRRPGGEADKDKKDDEAKPASPPTTRTSTGTSSPPPSSSPSPSTTPTSAPSSTGSAPSNTSSPTTSSTPSPTTPSPSTASKSSDAPKAPDSASSKPSDASSTKSSDSSASRGSDNNQPISDPNRPILRRGKPDPNAHHEPFVNFDDPVQAATASNQAGKEAAAAKAAAAASGLTVAAISDAAGPDPRPYTYDLKPAEEAIYRNKMLELAGQQLRPRMPANACSKLPAAAGKKSSSSKTAKPEFEAVNLRIFDLSNSNEPVLVLSARTPVPSATASGAQVPQEITLIARTNLEGELQKLFFAQTDARHLDLSPRMDLIDAVDADGDGRGELLFRRTFDSASAYAIYRVTADGLWPLWQPTP